VIAVAPTPPVLPAVKVHSAWVAGARATRVRELSLDGLPAVVGVKVRCHGGGCRFTARRVATHGLAHVSLTRKFKGARLRPGALVDVQVSDATGSLTVRFTVRRGHAPTKSSAWAADVPPGPGGPQPAPPAPGPGGGAPGPSQPGASKGQQALDVARRYIGTPFVWGGATPQTGFDDAGLVQYAYGQVGVSLPRVAYDQITVGTPVAQADLQPGDLVFFQDSTGYVHHVGLYAGDGQFVHAPHTGAVIGYSSLSEPYYAQEFAGGRRPA
jgi:cell wall-associated NlpC family hydrolase